LPVFAQTTPFLSEDEIRLLRNEISGDRAFEHIRVLTRHFDDLIRVAALQPRDSIEFLRSMTKEIA
jgi:hypothetical protein